VRTHGIAEPAITTSAPTVATVAAIALGLGTASSVGFDR
jgi:hypothetical protein